jgi:hypothetical protein
MLEFKIHWLSDKRSNVIQYGGFSYPGSHYSAEEHAVYMAIFLDV